jgi:hypothetical protein
VKIAVFGMMLSALAAQDDCSGPGSLSAANIRPGDGGVYVATSGGADGGEIFWPTAALPGGRQLRDLPSKDTLCMLYPGDWSDQTSYPKFIGTWIGDIKSTALLGPPMSSAEYTDDTTARLNYTYHKPNSADQVVTISLTFERLIVVEAKGAELHSDGTASKGRPWPSPYFLSGITAGGLSGAFYNGSPNNLECWDPFLRVSSGYQWTPCPWCKQVVVDYVPCDADPPSLCFL